MNLNIKPVDESNLAEVLNLQVFPKQQGFMETTEECLKDSADWPEFRPVGLYLDETIVGFAMYGKLRDSAGGQNVWKVRLLIDAKYQRQGYGRRFTELLLARLEAEYGESAIFLSVYENNTTAKQLYKSVGFEFIEEYDADGESIYRRG